MERDAFTSNEMGRAFTSMGKNFWCGFREDDGDVRAGVSEEFDDADQVLQTCLH